MSLSDLYTIWGWGIAAGLGFYFVLSLIGYGIYRAIHLLNS